MHLELGNYRPSEQYFHICIPTAWCGVNLAYMELLAVITALWPAGSVVRKESGYVL